MINSSECSFKKYTEKNQAFNNRPWLSDYILTPIWFCVDCQAWHCASTPPCDRCGIVINDYSAINRLIETTHQHLCKFCAELLKLTRIATKGYIVWRCGDFWSYGDYSLNKVYSLRWELQIVETELTINNSIYDIEALLNLYEKRKVLQRGIEYLEGWSKEDCTNRSRWFGTLLY